MSNHHVTNVRGEMCYTPNEKMKVKNKPETPLVEFLDFSDRTFIDLDYPLNDFGTKRKSISMDDIFGLCENVKTETNSNDHDCRPWEHPLEYSRVRFVSMVEGISHFHSDTPNRSFSSRRFESPQMFRSSGVTGHSGLTMPQSPSLRCETRAQPLHVMSQKDKEDLELEEIIKHEIKAHPIPKSVIEEMINSPEVPRKPSTIPEPFNLTETHIFEKPHMPVKPPVQVTKPISAKFHHKKNTSKEQQKHEMSVNQKPIQKVDTSNIRHRQVQPKPFSFEKRDQEIKKRKEEKIKRQIEEQKKLATSFKAQPLPGAIKKRMNSAPARTCSSSASSDNKENHIGFQAKPPTVLYKEPVIRQPLHCMNPAPFTLTSEKRAEEREKFDKQLKEEQEERKRKRQQREEEQKIFKKRAQAELRAELIHHAKPAPVLEPFIPEKPQISITVPETPTFIRRMKQREGFECSFD